MTLTPGPSAPVDPADDQVMRSATDKLLSDLGEVTVPDQPAPVDLADEGTAPRYYRLPLPSGGDVRARIASEGDPVMLTIPEALAIHPPTPGSPVLQLRVTRDVAWALWAVLSDALTPEPDAVPGWALQTAELTDEKGEPLPS
ncbi:hypothetical protein AB0C10_21555 [Microbispora amethystogenes]|uniref:hypothetical protein n=1 Tax=Microbispora amethystogenes TaxID=1427754 RepID=UPI0033D4C47E